MLEYNMDDWERMQREAQRRVAASRERNVRRAESTVPVPDFVRRSPQKQNRGIFDLLDLNRFEIDADRSMLLMMLALLSGEEKDELLTLALLYIML